MSQSLKDQLIQAGLARPQQPGKTRRPKRAKANARKPKLEAAASEPDLAQAYKARAEAERAERARERKRQAEREAQRRAAKQRIRDLVEAHRCNDETADSPYHFQVGDRIKHVHVTETQRAALAAGELAILLFDGQRHLLPSAVAREVLSLDAERFVLFPGETPQAAQPQP
jgi:uncharacterized protein YaiL (DUF2058 family)